jgi:adenine-specific DNA-methyltransferase
VDFSTYDGDEYPNIATKSDGRRSSVGGTIFPGDNLDYLSQVKDGFFQLILTSPPYNVGKSYERRTSLDAYLYQQERVISECIRTLAPGGSICWQVGNHVDNGEVFPLDILLYPIFVSRGLKLRNRIVWHFEHGLHCSKRLSGRHETILWFTKGDNYTFNLDPIRIPSKYPNKKHFKGPKKGLLSGNPLGKNPGDVWIFPNVKNNHVEKTSHPCQYPVELVERFVLSLTKPGDKIFDPYLGVGSTVVGAVKHGREGIGCEIDPEYAAIAAERLAGLLAGTLKMRPMHKPVYDPAMPKGGH